MYLTNFELFTIFLVWLLVVMMFIQNLIKHGLAQADGDLNAFLKENWWRYGLMLLALMFVFAGLPALNGYVTKQYCMYQLQEREWTEEFSALTDAAQSPEARVDAYAQQVFAKAEHQFSVVSLWAVSLHGEENAYRALCENGKLQVDKILHEAKLRGYLSEVKQMMITKLKQSQKY